MTELEVILRGQEALNYLAKDLGSLEITISGDTAEEYIQQKYRDMYMDDMTAEAEEPSEEIPSTIKKHRGPLVSKGTAWTEEELNVVKNAISFNSDIHKAAARLPERTFDGFIAKAYELGAKVKNERFYSSK